VYSPAGRRIGGWELGTTRFGEETPDVVAANHDRVVVLTNAVRVFSRSGKQLARWAPRIMLGLHEKPQRGVPLTGLTTTPNDHVIVLGGRGENFSGGAGVEIRTVGGRLVRRWAAPTLTRVAAPPNGVVAISNGRLLALSGVRLRLLTERGRELARWGRQGDAPGEFGPPDLFAQYGGRLAVDRRGRILVADAANDRVLRISIRPIRRKRPRLAAYPCRELNPPQAELAGMRAAFRLSRHAPAGAGGGLYGQCGKVRYAYYSFDPPVGWLKHHPDDAVRYQDGPDSFRRLPDRRWIDFGDSGGAPPRCGVHGGQIPRALVKLAGEQCFQDIYR
jgi:hypothetical protein